MSKGLNRSGDSGSDKHLSPKNPYTGDGKTQRDPYDKPRIDAYLDREGNPARKK